MNYKELHNLIISRINKDIEPHITEEEAVAYLGEDVIEKIDNIYKLAEEYGFCVHTHGTTQKNAQAIIESGFIWDFEMISDDVFNQKTDIKDYRQYYQNQKKRNIYDIQVATISSDISKRARTVFDIDTTQHFVKYFLGYSDLVARFITHNKGLPCQAIVFALIPKTTDNIFTENINIEKDEDEYYFYESSEIDCGFFIGYLDVPEKNVIFNPEFDMQCLYSSNNRSKAFKTTEGFLEENTKQKL